MPIVSLETGRALAVVTIRQSAAEPHQRADVSGIRLFARHKRLQLLHWRQHLERAGDIEPTSARGLRAVHSCLHRFHRLPHSVAVQGLRFGDEMELATWADMILVVETARPISRCTRLMMCPAASIPQLEFAPSHGPDSQLTTCPYEASL